MPDIHDWRQAGNPDELAQQIASTISQGASALLPSEIGYVLVTHPNRQLPEIANTIHRRDGYFEADEYLASIAATPMERALTSRFWPGPIGWQHDDLAPPGWVPRHAALASVLAKSTCPLAIFEFESAARIDPTSFADRVDWIVTVGDLEQEQLTLMRSTGARCEIIRHGVFSEEDLQAALARRMLFICTGNTCRSPMAEAIFKTRLAEQMGCGIEDLRTRGFSIRSAGVSALEGDPATSESVEAVGYHGGELSMHRSRQASIDEVARADDIIVMTRSHLLTLLSRYSVVSGSLRLLCGLDGDLGDPIGRGPEVYRACAAAVARHVDRLILEMGLS